MIRASRVCFQAFFLVYSLGCLCIYLDQVTVLEQPTTWQHDLVSWPLRVWVSSWRTEAAVVWLLRSPWPSSSSGTTSAPYGPTSSARLLPISTFGAKGGSLREGAEPSMGLTSVRSHTHTHTHLVTAHMSEKHSCSPLWKRLLVHHVQHLEVESGNIWLTFCLLSVLYRKGPPFYHARWHTPVLPSF